MSATGEASAFHLDSVREVVDDFSAVPTNAHKGSVFRAVKGGLDVYVTLPAGFPEVPPTITTLSGGVDLLVRPWTPSRLLGEAVLEALQRLGALWGKERPLPRTAIAAALGPIDRLSALRLLAADPDAGRCFLQDSVPGCAALEASLLSSMDAVEAQIAEAAALTAANEAARARVVALRSSVQKRLAALPAITTPLGTKEGLLAGLRGLSEQAASAAAQTEASLGSGGGADRKDLDARLQTLFDQLREHHLAELQAKLVQAQFRS